jgi:hypothetical protein
LDYIESELEKGKDLNTIKKDLIKIGHSEDKLKHIIDYHKSKQPFYKRIMHNEAFQSEKNWLISWLKVYTYIFSVIVVLFLGITIFILSMEPYEQPENYNERYGYCMSIEKGPYPEYKNLCLSMLTGDDVYCYNINDTNKEEGCLDAFYLYDFYATGNYKRCTFINDPSLKEFCFQLYEKKCNDYFGYGVFCNAIVNEEPGRCSSRENNDFYFMADCYDNYNFYNAFRQNHKFCWKIDQESLKTLCVALV